MTHTIERLPTGIEGLDNIAHGGLPAGRCTLVAGTSGSGKTVLALQFVVEGVRQYNEGGVIVTFEETVEDLTRNALSLGWDLAGYIEAGKVAIVDATPDPDQDTVLAGSFDLSALMARIEAAARRTKATRVAIDAIGALLSRFGDAQAVRFELYRIAAGLRRLSVTTIMTAERTDEDGGVARWDVEEFVADNAIILRNRLEQEKRRRTVEVLKFRGGMHRKGEYPFTIDAADGLTVIPLSAIQLTQSSSETRVSSGNEQLDQMCGGGIFRDSIVLVSGATGTGKTLTASQFVVGAVKRGERALLLAFEESREQLFRNASSCGIDLGAAETDGKLRIHCRYPESNGLEDHLIQIKRDIEQYNPHRIAIDSVSALERVGSIKSFREFVIGLTSHIKHKEIAGLLTNTTSFYRGSESITETHISSITDSIILLRYVELQGQMRRALTVLKMRGSQHDRDVREYKITNDGMKLGEAFRGVSGILTGTPTITSAATERAHLKEMFSEP
ncbi:MAG: circadian clock protein KaiC [Sandaracinaceae bacterium]